MSVIKTLHEALLNRGKIFKRNEILSLLNEYTQMSEEKTNPKKVIEYMSKHRYVKRIFLGYYYVNSYDEMKRKFCNFSARELIFQVLNREKIKWYLGLNTALYEQGKNWQTPALINIINTRISGEKKILGVKIRFVKMKENLIFGMKEKETENKVPYFYSDPAKTYLDKMYVRETLELTKVKNTRSYLKRYPKWVGRK